MNNAIERIKGYCTEVTQAQWDELVRVADEVGVNVGPISRTDGPDSNQSFAEWLDVDDPAYKCIALTSGTRHAKIPFPDFLAKLRGEEWTPKAGEMVEVSDSAMTKWFTAEYIAFSRDMHIVWCEGDDDDDVLDFQNARPLRPTITRAEAEAQLGKRIID